MRNKLTGHILTFILLAAALLCFFIYYAEAAEKVTNIDTSASCIASACHDDMGKKMYVHAVGVNGKLCSKCHEITEQGKHSFKKIPSETRFLCIKCHSEQFPPPSDIKGSPPKVISKDKDLKPHTPFAEGKCTECHDPHESNFYKHLKAQYTGKFYESYSAEAYSLCFKCHKEFGKTLLEPRTLTHTWFRNGNINLHYRHVNKVKGRTCRICHHYHSSKNPKLIMETFLFGKKELEINYKKTETGGSCETACHRIARYDRYDPVFNLIKTTPLSGRDATEEELRISKEKDMQKLKKKQVPEKEKVALKSEEKSVTGEQEVPEPEEKPVSEDEIKQ